ncbi:MAG: AMP-binding protein [Anaerolineales bacterium]|nr:AMP-binding protein [Anaerolineales bacterium]
MRDGFSLAPLGFLLGLFKETTKWFVKICYTTARRRHPDAVALHWIDRDRKLTYRQAVAEMERVAGALAALGVGHGDRVGILAHNGMDYPHIMFGAWRLGPSPPRWICNGPMPGSLYQ